VAKGDRIIGAEQINSVLLKVREVSPFDGDEQLSILALAFVVACRSCKVSKGTALTRLRQAFNTEIDTAPLPPVKTTH
jgi:Fe-S cluster biogenesis protein NfuA